MDELIDRLRRQIVAELRLSTIDPASIDPDAPLFGGDLGIDSIDALELMTLLEKHYGLKITGSTQGRKIFVSVRTMADFILANGRG